MNIVIFVIKLFTSLFRCLLLYLSIKHPEFTKTYLLLLENQQLRRIVKRHNLRPCFEPWEKHAVHECFTIIKNTRSFFTLVSPKTVLSLWKNAIAKYWSYKRKPGRPPISKAIKELILKLKKENFLWGARRIRDELKKLSIRVSHETISKVLRHFRKNGDIQPTLSWKRFLLSHWKTLFACDFFTVTAFGMVTYYVFFFMELKTRRIVQHGITTNPDHQFIRNHISVFEYDYPGSFLIHDNSGELRWFPFNQYDIKDVRITPWSPDMNAYTERFVRSIRQECLDYFIIFTEGQLRRIVGSYIDYYNNYRPHQGLKAIPNGPPESSIGTGVIGKKPLLFGLHNHYYREAS